jgi:hypothetical protein
MNLFGKVADTNDDRQKLDKKQNLHDTLLGIAVWFVFSFLCITLYALNAAYQEPAAGWGHFLGVLSNGALVSAAFISIGALLGFIFGIPRAPKSPPQASRSPQTSGASAGSADAKMSPEDDRRFTPNTNLEEISDWLTKILVGAGLVQLAVLPAQLKRLADFFHASMPLTSEAALMIILNFFVLGFMGSYLLTRLFLTEAFQTVEGMRAASLAVARVAQDLLLDISPGAPKEEKDAKYESYIYTCLYLDPPEGFERAIKACSEYLQDAGDSPNPRILAYQAMAYGQKYDWEQKRGATKEFLASLRKSALESVRGAVAGQSQLRHLLRTTWDPNDPTKLRGEENDLEVFFGDPEFEQILDRSGT